jgi:hypothetical protein
MDKHPGIRIDKIPIKGGAGLLFVAGILMISLIATPFTRWFFLISLMGGALGATVLYFWRKR